MKDIGLWMAIFYRKLLVSFYVTELNDIPKKLYETTKTVPYSQCLRFVIPIYLKTCVHIYKILYNVHMPKSNTKTYIRLNLNEPYTYIYIIEAFIFTGSTCYLIIRNAINNHRIFFRHYFLQNSMYGQKLIS